jgi:hypothetical protein
MVFSTQYLLLKGYFQQKADGLLLKGMARPGFVPG